MEKDKLNVIMLTEDELNKLIKDAGAAGAKVALKKLEEKKNALHKEIMDKRLHNTKLLLENYRLLKLNMENSIYEKSQMNESAADILNNMMNLYDDEVIIDSIKRSAVRTAIIISHIDKMLSIFEIYCNQSRKSTDKRKYQVIYDYYIASDKLEIGQIMAKQHYGKQTIYDDIKSAESSLTALFFGIDGLKLK